MARNKHPEETVQRILETASRLFIECGYEETSIQDILNALGNLSKGAIYHHFRSKEDLLNAVMEQLFSDSETILQGIMQDPSLNGRQRLQQLIECSVSRSEQTLAFSMSLDMVKNPRILALQFENTMKEVSFGMILPILREGMADGSIPKLPFPEETAQVFMLLSNIWLNPMVCPGTLEELRRRCLFLRDITRGWGFEEDLISDLIMQKLTDHAAIWNEKRSERQPATNL